MAEGRFSFERARPVRFWWAVPTLRCSPTHEARARKQSGGSRRSAGESAGEKGDNRRRGSDRTNFGDDDARPGFGDRKRRESALRHEAADDAIVIARRAAFVFAALADVVFVAGVMVMRAMSGGGLGDGGSVAFARVAPLAGVRMPHAAERAGQHVADRYGPGDSAMASARDHDALWLQMQSSCMIISRPRRQGQCSLR